MKKRGKSIVITVLILLLITVAPFLILYLLSGEKQKNLDESELRELDEEGSRAYIYSTPADAKALILEGDGKNVLTFGQNTLYDVGKSAENKKRLQRLNERTAPTFEEPVIAYNPFGVLENTLYFYFETNRKLLVRYTITVQDEAYHDFTRRVYTGLEDNLSQKHEFTVGGLIPGMTNYIILELYDSKGTLINHMLYKLEAKKSAVSAPSSIRMERGKCEETSSNGLYFLGAKEKKAILIYDNSGTLRGEIRTEGASEGQPILQGKDFIFAASKTKFVRLNSLGEVMGVYKMKGYSDFESFTYDGYGNLFAIAQNKKEKALVRIDMRTGGTVKVQTLDARLSYPDLYVQADGKVVIYCGTNSRFLQVSGAAGNISRITGVSGEKKDWKDTKYRNKKKVKVGEQPMGQKPDGRREQKYKGHVIRMEGQKGRYGEYGSDGKNIKTFETGFSFSKALKMDLKEYCFY